MKHTYTLSFRIPAIISGIIIVTIVVLSIISIISSREGIKEATLDGFSTTATGYAYMLDMILHEQLSLVQTYALSSHVRNFLEDKTNIEKETILLDRVRAYSNINTYAINIGIADTDGTILLDSFDNKLKGTSLKTQYNEVFNTMVANNYQFTFDRNTIISSSTGQEAVLLVGGVRKNNQLLGLLYVNIDLAMLNKDFIESLKLKGGARLTIVNSKNIALMSSAPNTIGTTMADAYQMILSQDEGIIPSVHNEKMHDVRSGAFKTSSIMPWTVLFAKPDSEIYKAVNSIIFRNILIGACLIIISSVLVFYYIKTITNPLHKLVYMAQEISEGNLAVDDVIVKRHDELGVLSDSFFNMRHKLLDIISKVRKSVDQITMDAQELSSGSANLSNRTETQAASLEETASSMEQMASTIRSSTDQSVEGNRMMIESKEAIENAGVIILETTRNIEEVNEASAKIKDITKIIENIAFQTNILALNAAVEAARAGDQGRGFAVVASEVRNLAQTTQTSVKDITDLVDNAYDKINKATNSARTSQEIFNEIQSKIEETARIMQDISSTAVEQQSGVDQVNRAVAEMDTVTQQNAALVEEATASSESLLYQAKDLVAAMSFFKLSSSEISSKSSKLEKAENKSVKESNKYITKEAKKDIELKSPLKPDFSKTVSDNKISSADSSYNKYDSKKSNNVKTDKPEVKSYTEDKPNLKRPELKRPPSLSTTKNNEFGDTIVPGTEDSEGFAQF